MKTISIILSSICLVCFFYMIDEIKQVRNNQADLMEELQEIKRDFIPEIDVENIEQKYPKPGFGRINKKEEK